MHKHTPFAVAFHRVEEMSGLCDCVNCVIYLLCVVVYSVILQKFREKKEKRKQEEKVGFFFGGVKVDLSHFSKAEK